MLLPGHTSATTWAVPVTKITLNLGNTGTFDLRAESWLGALSLQEEEVHSQEGAKAQPRQVQVNFGAPSSRCVCGRAGGEPRGREELFLAEIKWKAATEHRGGKKRKTKKSNPTKKPPADLI